MTYGPALQRMLLADTLEALRKAAGYHASEVAKRFRVQTSQVSHWETGRNPPNFLTLQEMLVLYGASDRLEEMDGWRVGSNRTTWWSPLPPPIRRYVGLEADAARIIEVTREVVPAVLQTEGYTRAMFTAHDVPPEDVEWNVEIRQRRGKRVKSGEVGVVLVASEALLTRTSYMGQVGLDQLEYLRAAASSPRVWIRFVPFALGVYPGMGDEFTLLEFPPNTLEPMAYQDHVQQIALVRKSHIVNTLRKRFERTAALALSLEESIEMIDEYVEGAREAIDARSAVV